MGTFPAAVFCTVQIPLNALRVEQTNWRILPDFRRQIKRSRRTWFWTAPQNENLRVYIRVFQRRAGVLLLADHRL